MLRRRRATSAGRSCLLRSASDDASSILVARNASLDDVAVAATFAQHAYAEHGLLQLLWRLGAVADSDTLEAQEAYSCLWSTAEAAGATTAAATVHLRAGERVLAASQTFDAHINVLYSMSAAAVGGAVSCNVTGGDVDVRLAASDAAYSAGTFGLEVYKGDTAFWQSVAVHDLAR